MNRYGRSGYVGGASSSKASANTVCQKCLKKGHYSYECKAQTQERPYISRPSRSQQLLNPKLKPKLTNIAPEPTEQEKSSAGSSYAKEAFESSRKRPLDEMDDHRPSRKRSRSVSSYSSASVSTISTRSPSPDRPRHRPTTHRNLASQREDRDGSATGGAGDKRRRRSSSASSSDHTASHDGHNRNTRLRRSSKSPSERGRRRVTSGRRMRSASGRDSSRDGRGLPEYNRRADPDDRPKLGQRTDLERHDHHFRDQDREMKDVPGADSRPRSLSPFSKRVALTQASNK